MILIDLQKAFDCVDHALLVRKLAAMGVASTDWFHSYLNDRSQCTQVKSIDSSFLNVNCGVPQGSILGPTLFLCYINDMAEALSCRLSLYADDSALLHSGPDPKLVADFLSSQLSICHSWLIDNRLSLHLGKTECILFGPKRRLKRVTDFTVKLGNAEVNRVTSVKYLGVFLDQHMNFSTHVENVLSKARSKLAFLYRNRGFLNYRTRKLLCQSLIFSCIEYCSSSWYPGLLMGLRDSIDVFQRKSARFVLDHSPRSHIANADYGFLSWLPFPKRVSYFNLIHLFKVRTGLSPSYLANGFTDVSAVHGYNLRQCEINFSLARCFLPVGTFQRTVIQEWNALPLYLKEIRSLSNFKSRLKCYLQSA